MLRSRLDLEKLLKVLHRIIDIPSATSKSV